MKYFGRLAGNTNAHTALMSVPSAAVGTPFTAPSPGAKLFTLGENFSHDAASRALTALAANNDYIAGLLDSPVMRDDFLEPMQTPGADTFGLEALAGVVQGATAVNLGDASGGTDAAAVWLYHGLFIEQLSECIRLVRQDADGVTEIREPADVYFKTGGADTVFRTVATTGSPTRRYPKACAPMRRVETDLPPYLGNDDNGVVAVSSWDYDGVVLKAATFASRYARPGCYVEAVGGSGNNGLYRIAYTMRSEDTGASGTGDKAVLTRGGLHKVTVEDGTQFTAGDRVSWQTPSSDVPSNHTAVSTADERDNFAYCMYIAGNDLWLLPASGSEEFLVDGKAVGVNNDNGDFTGSVQAGQVGLWDQESDASANHGLLNGTRLYSQAETNSLVSAVEHAGSPVRFDPNQDLGSIYIVSPPGFALSPELVFTAGDLIGGDYGVDCRTLSTFRERLQSQGMSAAPGLSEDPSTRLGLSRSEQVHLRAWMKAAKVGLQDSATSLVTGVNTPMAPPARVLGEDLWKVTVTNDDDVGTTAEDAGAAPGANLGLYNRDEPSTPITRALVVSVTGNVMVLQRVRKTFGSASEWAPEDDWSSAPIVVGGDVGEGSDFPAGGDTFRVTSIQHAPILDDDVGTDRFLSGGLNDSYWNLLDRDRYSRYQGAGRFIEMHASRPLSLLLPSGAGVKEGVELRQSGGGVDAVTIRDRDAAAVINALFGTHETNDEAYIGALNRTLGLTNEARTLQARLHWTPTGSSAGLGFSDEHTGLGNKVPFSSADLAALPLHQDSMLSGIHHGQAGLVAGEGGSPAAAGFRQVGDGLIGPARPAAASASAAGVAAGIAVLIGDCTVNDGSDLLQPGAGQDMTAFLSQNDWVGMVNVDTGEWYYSQVGVVLVGEAPLTTDPGFSGSVTAYKIASPLDVAASAALYMAFGATYRASAAAVTMPTSVTRYLVWNVSTRGYTLQAGYDTDGGQLCVAKITSDGTGVTAVEDLSPRLSRLESRVPITVGTFTSGTQQYQDMAAERVTFPTVGEAFKMIEVIEAEQTVTERFAWHIRVVGETIEVVDPTRGLSLPLQVPASDIVVEGGGVGSGAERPTVQWGTAFGGANTPLFSLDAVSGVVFRNLDMLYSGGAATSAANATIAAFQHDALSALDSVLIDACSLTNGASFVHLTVGGGGRQITVQGCRATGITGAGVVVDDDTGGGVESVVVQNCQFFRAAPANKNAVTPHGVAAFAVDNVVVRDCVFDGFTGESVLLDGVLKHGVVTGCTITGALHKGIRTTGIDAAAAVHISDSVVTVNMAGGDDLDADAWGVQLDGGGRQAMSNVTVFDARNYGISVTSPKAQLTNCTVVTSSDEAINVGAADCLLSNCTVEGATGDGIKIGAAAKTMLTGCHIHACGSNGLEILASDDVRVLGCYIEDTVTHTSGDALHMIGNTLGGVTLTAGDDHRLLNNTLSASIQINGGDDATFQGNKGVSVILDGGDRMRVLNNNLSGLIQADDGDTHQIIGNIGAEIDINAGADHRILHNDTDGQAIDIEGGGGNVVAFNNLMATGADGSGAGIDLNDTGNTKQNVVVGNIVDAPMNGLAGDLRNEWTNSGVDNDHDANIVVTA